MSSFLKKLRGASKEDKNTISLEPSKTSSSEPIRVLVKLQNLSNNSQESQYIRLNPSEIIPKSDLFKLIQSKFQDSGLEESLCKLSFFDVKLKTDINIVDAEGVEDFMIFAKNAAPEDKLINVKYQPNKTSSSSDFPSTSFAMSSSIASFKSSEYSTYAPSSNSNNSQIRNDSFSQETVDGILERRYSEIARLDSGAFGVVYKVVDRKNGKEKALKIMNIENVSDINNALQEAMKMTKLTHPHIVSTLDVFLPGVMSRICIEMELMPKGSLYAAVIKPKLELNEYMLKELIKQVCSALFMMQQTDGTIHRDIKPQNILVRDLDTEKLIINVAMGDFGLAKSLDNLAQSVGIAGTMNFLAPELLHYSVNNSGSNPFSFASDMFALGVSIYQLITFDMVTSLATLVTSQDEEDFKNFISRKILERGKFSKDFIELIYSMLRRDPKERISAEMAVSCLSIEDIVNPSINENTQYELTLEDLNLDNLNLDIDLNSDDYDLNIDDLNLDGVDLNIDLDIGNEETPLIFLTEVDQIESSGNNDENLDFKSPLGIIIQKRQNRLIISNFINSNLLSLDLTTKKIEVHTNLGDMPDKMCYSSIDDTFVISFMGKVSKFSSTKNGKEIWSYPVKRAKGVACVESDGTIFVGDASNGNILVLSKDGSLLRTISGIGIVFPTDMCLSADQCHLIVCDKEKDQLLFVSKEGSILQSVACGVEMVPFAKPYVVNVDNRNNYIVEAEYDSNYLRMYNGKTAEYLTMSYVEGTVCGCLTIDSEERKIYAFYGKVLKIFTY